MAANKVIILGKIGNDLINAVKLLPKLAKDLGQRELKDSDKPNEERVELSPKPELKENGKLEDDAAKLHPKPAQEHCESKDSNDERPHFPNPEQTDSDKFKEKIRNYFFKSEVQALHKAISDSAQHIDKSSSTADYLSEVKD